MNIALVNGQRQEAQPGLPGVCPLCGNPVIAKCGKARLRIWHWAHKAGQHCDSWKREETAWHRNWKNQFPVEWQEHPQHAANGEKHIADVKTVDGWVLEFQHSRIEPEEREAREGFWRTLFWVVDGTKRKRDRAQLIGAWNNGGLVGGNQLVRKVFSGDCGLLREWAGSSAQILFDLGDTNLLWWLFGRNTNGFAYIAPFSRAQFIERHRSTGTEAVREFDAFVNDIPKLIAARESILQAQPSGWAPLRPRRFRRSFRL